MSESSKIDPDHASEPFRPCVRFSPPLSDQRQIFLLDTLRKHKPESVLDIGCGEGGLLEAISRPSFALPLSSDFDERHGIPSDASMRCPEDICAPLNVMSASGLDISEGSLERAGQAIQAIDDPSNFGKYSKPRPRWSSLEMNLWQGALQVFNPALKNYEVIVSSEVIEHLDAGILDCFCPMVLGRYDPRVLVITTPGFEFNQLFTTPENVQDGGVSSPAIREGGYLDPTGRTQRVFRHHDHKFEWTRSEFRDWCISNAKQWGYSVVISGVGTSTVRDPWGRDQSQVSPEGGELPIFASQTAVFIRLVQDVEEHRHQYEKYAMKTIESMTNGQTNERHRLFAHHSLLAHPALASNQPISSNRDILEIIKRSIAEICGSLPGEVEIWDLWNIDAVSLACQGDLERLYAVLEAEFNDTQTDQSQEESIISTETPIKIEWEWIEPEKRTRWTRKLRWNYYVPAKEGYDIWEAQNWDSTLLDTQNSDWVTTTSDFSRGEECWNNNEGCSGMSADNVSSGSTENWWETLNTDTSWWGPERPRKDGSEL